MKSFATPEPEERTMLRIMDRVSKVAESAVDIHEKRHSFYTRQAAEYEKKISKLETDAAQNVDWRMELRAEADKWQQKYAELARNYDDQGGDLEKANKLIEKHRAADKKRKSRRK